MAAAAIIAVILCYFVLLAKLKPENESSEFSKSLQEMHAMLSVQQKMELLEKIIERIKEYLDRRKQKLVGS